MEGLKPWVINEGKTMRKLWMVLLIGAAAVCRAEYVDEVTADAPEAMYGFNKPAGATTLSDATGNGHGSLLVSNVTFGATGSVDSAAVFSNGLVELDLHLDPSAGDFSVETLIRFDAAGNVLQQLDGTGTGRAMLYRLSDGTIGSYLGGENIASSTLIATGEWHHVVMTVEEAGTNDVISFYIDGQSAGSGTTDVEATDGNWRIGKGNLIGAIDELAVYTNLLSAEQVMDHYSWVTAGDEDAGDSPVHYVSTNGASIYPYTNWATAARYIQQAVNAAAAGDTVLVTNGTYASGAQITVTRAITLESVNGPGVTIVDGLYDHRCFSLGNTACTLSGWTIQNGVAAGGLENDYSDESNDGGGVYCTGTTPVITNCVLTHNWSFLDGGGSSGGTLTHCTLSNNGSTYGGGGGSCDGILMYCVLSNNDSEVGGGSCDGTLTHCTLTDNWGDSGGGNYGGTLTYCTLSGNNSSDEGGGSYKGTLIHCTLTGNSADYGGGSYEGTLKNCILWGNTASDGGDNVYNCSITNCCWPEADSETGCVADDPCFVDADAGDYHLVYGSPCMDAGLTNVTDVAEDLDGTPVPADGDLDGVALPDMGAYEYVPDTSDDDGDGLSHDAEVYLYGTDPADSDSDDDGLSDYEEVKTYGTDPMDPDCDDDGRSDSEEVVAGFDPTYDETDIIATVIAGVTNAPSAYGLYSTNTIADLALGGVMVEISNGWVRLNLQLEQCTNLVDGVWTNAGDAVEWQLEAPDDKVFYRVRSSE